MRPSITPIIVRYPWLVLLGLAVIWGLALNSMVDWEARTTRLVIDPDLQSLLPRAGEAREIFDHTRARFGSDDMLLVAWFDDDLFSHERLAALKRLSRRLERMPGVVDVDSLANAPIIRNRDDYTDVEPFLRRLPDNAAESQALLGEALANPLYVGQLVAADGRGALLAVHLDAKLGPDAQYALYDRISAAAVEEAGGTNAVVTGPLSVRLAISRALFADLFRVMPLAVLCTAVVAAIGFRSVRGTLLPLVSNLFALSLMLAAFVLAGHALNFVTVILPPVIYVVGFAYAVHVVSSFDRIFPDCATRMEAVRATLGEVRLPVTLTAFTTLVGFASLTLSSIASIRLFGQYAALGTMLAWFAALTLVPAALCVMPAGGRPPTTDAASTRIAASLAAFALRFRSAMFAGAVALALGSVIAASHIEVSTDYLNNFPATHPVRSDFERAGAMFAGSVPLQVLIESDITDGFKDPAQLQIVADLQAWIAAQPEIGGVYSLVDYIGVLNRGLALERSGGHAIPANAALTEQLLMLGGGEDLDRFADSRFTSTLMHVHSSVTSTRDLVALAARIEARLAELPAHLRGHVTGSSYLVARSIDDITRGQVTSLALAFGVIYLVMVVLFGSLRVGALALLPNVLPVFAFFAILGASGITLNLTTSLVAAIALGIAVDDTIHFLTRFNDEARKVADERAGVAAALAIVIRPVTFTTAALCAGFLALVSGSLENQVQFGLLAAAVLAFAWFVDLTFTPALASRLRFVTLWETLTLDLGAAPHRSIPLFAGLSKRQARIAALMGVMKQHPQGAHVINIGDKDRAVCVVIDGELQASVPHDGGDLKLRMLRRGDLMGEVALFHGTRTANVVAESDVRVLHFTEACLARLQQRYPRIGAQIYRNLGVILADRLADTTARL